MSPQKGPDTKPQNKNKDEKAPRSDSEAMPPPPPPPRPKHRRLAPQPAAQPSKRSHPEALGPQNSNAKKHKSILPATPPEQLFYPFPPAGSSAASLVNTIRTGDAYVTTDMLKTLGQAAKEGDNMERDRQDNKSS